MPGPWNRPALILLAAAAPFFLALCGCSASRLDVIQVGPWFAPRSAGEVTVYASREETRGQWGGIGIIHGPRVSPGSKEIEKHKRAARAEAARMGADGVILIVEPAADDNRLDINQEPEVYLSGLAIKYAANVSTSAAQ